MVQRFAPGKVEKEGWDDLADVKSSACDIGLGSGNRTGVF